MSNNELTRAQTILAQEIRLLVRENVNLETSNLIPAERLASLVPLGVKWEIDTRVNPFTALKELEKALADLHEDLPSLTTETQELLEEQILALASDALMGDL